MSNTIIQIKRSTVTATPATLNVAELAYSYSSNTLFIGNSSGTGVIAIGGPGFSGGMGYANAVGVGSNNWTNTVQGYSNSYAVTIGASSNAWTNTVQGYSNSYAVSIGAASNTWANTTQGNAQAYANGVGVGANNQAGLMSNAANSYAAATYLPLSGGTLTGSLVINQNLTVSGTTTYVNTQSLLIGDSVVVLNADLPSTAAPTENAGIEVNRGNANANAALVWVESAGKWYITGNTWAGNNNWIATNADISTVGAGANAYAVTVGAASNTWANTVSGYSNNWANTVAGIANSWANTQYGNALGYANSVGTGSNNYAVTVGAASNTWANTTQGNAQAYANAVGTGSNNYAVTVGAASNTWANTQYGNALTYANAVGAGSNTYASNANNISSGILNVAFGGTGVQSVTLNGVLFGRGGNGSLQITAAGTEGQVLQASATGVPSFGMLDGGVF